MLNNRPFTYWYLVVTCTVSRSIEIPNSYTLVPITESDTNDGATSWTISLLLCTFGELDLVRYHAGLSHPDLVQQTRTSSQQSPKRHVRRKTGVFKTSSPGLFLRSVDGSRSGEATFDLERGFYLFPRYPKNLALARTAWSYPMYL